MTSQMRKPHAMSAKPVMRRHRAWSEKSTSRYPLIQQAAATNLKAIMAGEHTCHP